MTRIRAVGFIIASVIACANCLGQSTQEPCPASSTQSAQTDGVSPPERQALIALYEATDGSHWKNHGCWLGSAGTECNWYGVQCGRSSKDPARVLLLQLSENNLVGSIPEEIGGLTALRSLDISGNHLKGSFPNSVGEFAQLENLDVFGNHFSGRLPDPLIRRSLSGSLWIIAETSLLTDVTEVDFESDPSMLLCGRRRIILSSDGSVALSTVRCRNATPKDRRTFCEVKQGKVNPSSFAALAWLVEKNGFYALQDEYWRNITEGTFESIRVSRSGKAYEVVNYADGGPFGLWVIERAIEGVALSAGWEKTKTQSECSRWKDAKAPKQSQPTMPD